MRYDILTAVLLKNPVFWDVMLCWAADRGTVILSSVRNCSPSRSVSSHYTQIFIPPRFIYMKSFYILSMSQCIWVLQNFSGNGYPPVFW